MRPQRPHPRIRPRQRQRRLVRQHNARAVLQRVNEAVGRAFAGGGIGHDHHIGVLDLPGDLHQRDTERLRAVLAVAAERSQHIRVDLAALLDRDRAVTPRDRRDAHIEAERLAPVLPKLQHLRDDRAPNDPVPDLYQRHSLHVYLPGFW